VPELVVLPKCTPTGVRTGNPRFPKTDALSRIELKTPKTSYAPGEDILNPKGPLSVYFARLNYVLTQTNARAGQ